jgi:myo-inositol-1(or 4)-monophosphatase
MDFPELDEALASATDVARDAGAVLSEGFRRPMTVRNKGAIDLVTEFDLRSEALVRDRLGALFPSHRVVAEEGSAGDSGATSADLVWYVDPLDGTTNFAHGHPFFAVSLGLYRGREGLLGVVHAPALGLTWTARRNGGALRNGQPCSVADHPRLQETLGATGFPYDVRTNPDDNTREFREFLKRTRGVRRCGSAALDLAMVADGTYGFYWEQYLSPWDMAAGAVLVAEAGGHLTDFTGGPADPLSGRLLASNQLLHDEALAVLREVRSGR